MLLCFLKKKSYSDMSTVRWLPFVIYLVKKSEQTFFYWYFLGMEAQFEY